MFRLKQIRCRSSFSHTDQAARKKQRFSKTVFEINGVMKVKVVSIVFLVFFSFAGLSSGGWGESIEDQIYEFSDIRHIPNLMEVPTSDVDYYKKNKYPNFRFNHRVVTSANSSSGNLFDVVTVGYRPTEIRELRNPFLQREVTVKELSLFLSSEHNLAEFRKLLGGLPGDHGMTYRCSWHLWLRNEIESPSFNPVIVNVTFKKPPSSSKEYLSVDSYPCLYSTMIVGELKRK